ncbi:MAG: cytochrome c [Chloroflexi bacterium]|nr:cytochrome c [Chloroflexota bacterium]
MNLPAWLRFAELSLLAGWLVWRAYRPARRRSDAWLPLTVFGLAAAQLILEAQAATDPFTPLTVMLPVVLTTVYGALSATICVLAIGAAVWILRGPAMLSWLPALVLIACAATSTASAADAVSAAASSGDIMMSPSFAIPRSTLSTPNPYANDPASVQRGRIVYQQYCLTCHGLNGDGNGPAVAGLRIRPPTFRNPQHFLASGMDGAHFWAIQHGDGQPSGMPAWNGTLTDQQTWDAVNYIKAIAAGTANSAGGSPTAS